MATSGKQKVAQLSHVLKSQERATLSNYKTNAEQFSGGGFL